MWRDFLVTKMFCLCLFIPLPIFGFRLAETLIFFFLLVLLGTLLRGRSVFRGMEYDFLFNCNWKVAMFVFLFQFSN